MGHGTSRPITLVVHATLNDEANAKEFYKVAKSEIRGYASSFRVYKKGRQLRVLETYPSNNTFTKWLTERGFNIHKQYNRGYIVVTSITVLGALSDSNRDLLNKFNVSVFDSWM